MSFCVDEMMCKKLTLIHCYVSLLYSSLHEAVRGLMRGLTNVTKVTMAFSSPNGCFMCVHYSHGQAYL